MTKTDYKRLSVYPETHKKLKVISAKRGKPIIKMIDEAVALLE